MRVVFCVLLLGLGVGAWKLLTLLAAVTLEQWGGIGVATLGTLGRVLAATIPGYALGFARGAGDRTLPGLAASCSPSSKWWHLFRRLCCSPSWSRDWAIAGIGLGWGSILLMLLGTQWYILFNVIAGASAIPADLKEMSKSYRITGWQYLRDLYFPGVFPYLVTGWVTAAGGIWNASIVSEWYTVHKDEIMPHLGSRRWNQVPQFLVREYTDAGCRRLSHVDCGGGVQSDRLAPLLSACGRTFSLNEWSKTIMAPTAAAAQGTGVLL